MTTAKAPAPACLANIGPRERRRRMRLGAAFLVVGVALAVVLAGVGAHRLWRLLLFLPFWAAAMGVLQAWEKT